MEIRIKTKKDYHSGSNKTLTVISAFIVGILLTGCIGYAIYVWKNKPATLFSPVKNKKISVLLKDSKDVKAENIQEDGKLAQAERILKRLKQECKDKKLLDEKENIQSKDKYTNLSEDIEKALKNGKEAENAIKNFMEIKKASKKDDLKKVEFNELVHKTIKTPADKLAKKPTDQQIQAARKQLTENLVEVQTAWDKGKEGNMSYEALYVLCRLVEEYTRIKAIVDQNKKPKQ